MKFSMRRSTHSDLAAIIYAHINDLASIPAHFLVNDASTLSNLRGAAEALIAQDRKIEEQTIALRHCYEAGYKQAAAALS